MNLRDIAKEIGCSHSGIDVMLRGHARGETRRLVVASNKPASGRT
jgi:hypothetical protein